MRNPGTKPLKAGAAVGYKFGNRDHRPSDMFQTRFNRFGKYSFGDNFAQRDGKLIYYFDQKPARQWSTEGNIYSKGNFNVLERWRVSSLVEYAFELAPGEARSFTFKFPQDPVPPESDLLTKLNLADYVSFLNKMTKFWAIEITRGMTINLAEPKVMNASRAARVHNIMTQEYPAANEVLQAVNRFQYNRFWLRDGSFFATMYALWWHTDTSQKLLRHFLRYQDKTGNFLSQKGQLDGFGESLWAFGEYLKLTGDKTFAAELLPHVKAAMGWFEKTIEKDEYGLMPATSALDNEFIIGRYTGHNLWALAGAIEVAKAAGDEKSAQDFALLRDKFAKNLRVRIGEAAARNHGRIPPGMDVPGGIDWGNLFEVFPANFMSPDDPLVTNTFSYYRKHHFQEGISTYRASMHHYITERVTEMSVRQGRQEEALGDLYSMLLHTGSCHQGFEFEMYPWSNRDYCPEAPGGQFCNFPPHGWYAALFNILLRNMLVREQDNDLHLMSVTSPEWLRPGDEINVYRAPTYFGTVSYKAAAGPTALKLTITSEFRNPPGRIVVHFPFFAEVSQVVADGVKVEFQPGQVALPAATSQVEISWRLKPAPHYSYQSYVKDYRREYEERYNLQYK